jgi:hypothetical protein
MDKQRGGSFTVNGWLALLLLATAVAAGATSYYLGKHRAIIIQLTHPVQHNGYHAFPEGRQVCSGFNTICWIRI